MPSGIYKNRINLGNIGSFKKGHPLLKGSEKGWFKKGVKNNSESEHPLWKGEEASYTSMHKWVYRKLGSPNFCNICGNTTAKRYEWSNKDHKYARKLEDYTRMCVSCHRKYDCKLRKK